MKITIILVVLSVGATKVSADLYGSEIATTPQWWNNNLYIKFNTPIGKTFYINFFDGIISRERRSELFPLTELIESTEQSEVTVSNAEVPLNEDEKLPFISFVSQDLKIYYIHFECNDDLIECTTKLEESEFIFESKDVLIRHRLDSFVGPNKKQYQVVYNVSNELQIKEKSPEITAHFQIKTFGPYEKWAHTYDFSENGELATDHTISPVPVSANRSILLPKWKASTFTETMYPIFHTFVQYRAPAGTKYHITNLLDIIEVPNSDIDEGVYISFTEPNGRTYDIFLGKEDGHPVLVEKSVTGNYFEEQRLYSFVAPNRILYRIDHKNETDHEVPVLVANSSDSSDLQITLCRPSRTYNEFVKYVFSEKGTKLVDRVDEIDWTPLNAVPEVPVEEVTAEYIAENLPFLTLYTPSGSNYHFFTNGTKASIAVEKTIIRTHQSLYISYLRSNGSRANIYLTAGDHPYLEEEAATVQKKDPVSFWLISFVTPDRKEYSIKSRLGDNSESEDYVELPSQVIDPIDSTTVDALSIIIQNENGSQYVYRFTWNGDKLIEVSLLPASFFVPSKVLQSLIGK